MNKSSALSLSLLVCFAGCGGGARTVPPLVPSQFAQSGNLTQLPALSIDAVPVVSGTYSGTFTETASGHTRNGTIATTINQSGSNISGPVTVTVGGTTGHLTESGTVKAGKNGIALLKFTVFSPNGRNALAHGTIFGKHFNGKAVVPPKGSQPQVNITYKMLKH